MYTIYYILDDKMDLVHCFTKDILLHNYHVLLERKAKIVCIKDGKGQRVLNIDLT